MAVNASIYNALGQGVRSIEEYNALADQREQAQQARIANALGLQVQQEQLQNQRRQFADAEALRGEQQALYQALPGVDLSQTGAQNDLMARFPRAAPSALKAWQERQTQASKIADEQSQTAARISGEVRRTLGAVFANPSKQFAHSQLAAFKAQFPNANTDVYAAQIDALPDDPNAIKQWAAGHGTEVDKLLPKLGVSDSGGANNFYTQSPVTGAVDFTHTEKKTQTPDSVASNARQAADNAAARAQQERASQRADARAREGNEIQRQAARSRLVETADGVMIVDMGTSLARPAATMNGQPLPGKETALNETQSKALSFGDRMRSNGTIIDQLEKQGTTNRGAIKAAAETGGRILGLGTDGMGGTLADVAGTLTNFTQSEGQAKYEAAKRNWIAATLRKESGAAIGAGEYRDADNQYFPQPNDPPAVIAQKRKLRADATRNMLAEVPAKKRPKDDAPLTDGGWSIKPKGN